MYYTSLWHYQVKVVDSYKNLSYGLIHRRQHVKLFVTRKNFSKIVTFRRIIQREEGIRQSRGAMSIVSKITALVLALILLYAIPFVEGCWPDYVPMAFLNAVITGEIFPLELFNTWMLRQLVMYFKIVEKIKGGEK